MVLSRQYLTIALCALSLISGFSLTSCEAPSQSTTQSVDSRLSDARDRNDGPPIWLAQSEGAKLYLFGTVHFLPADLEWQKPDMQAAFQEAGTVFFEVDSGETASIQARVLTNSLGMQRDGQRLSDKLDSYELKLLEAAAHNSGIDRAVLDTMKPWLVSEFLMVLAARNAGLSPDLSADEALKSRARRQGKNILFLEDIETQIRLASDQSDETQLNSMVEAMEGFNRLGDETAEIVKHWSTGRTDLLSQKIIAEVKEISSDHYDRLIVSRNKDWLAQFQSFLDHEGTGFVAVGVSHLLGEDGLPTLLKAQGYKVERYYAFDGPDVIKPIDLDVAIGVED